MFIPSFASPSRPSNQTIPTHQHCKMIRRVPSVVATNKRSNSRTISIKIYQIPPTIAVLLLLVFSTTTITNVAQQQSPSTFSIISSSIIPSFAIAVEADEPKLSYADRQRQKAYAERERQKRRKLKKLKAAEEKYNRLFGNDQDDDDDDDDEGYTVRGLFVTEKPRDVLVGIRAALSNALRGATYGIGAFVASPLSGIAEGGVVGFIKGLVLGSVVGVVMPVVGLAIGVYQMLRGVVATPEAIVDGFWGCKVWDEKNHTWGEYRLNDDLEEIKTAMKKEEENARANRKNERKDYVSSQKVKNTEYYDIFGVTPDATSSEIRSAYRKKARIIHPDKNPDDPDAEKKFRELSAAYQTLSDPDKRKRYDASGEGVNPEQAANGEGGLSMLDPYVFFAVLFASEQVEPYIGELGLAHTFDALLKLGDGGPKSFESWEHLKMTLGWNEVSLKKRKRQADIAVHLRNRVSDYVDGFLALDAFKESCWEEAVNIAKGGSYGATFLLAIGPALVAEADSFLGYRASVLGSWRGPVSNAKRNFLFLRRKFAVTKAVLRTAKDGLKAIYESAEFTPDTSSHDEPVKNDRSTKKKPERVSFSDKQLLQDNLSSTIPTILDMAWSLNYIDISNTLYEACSKLFYDADVSSWEERLRRAEAVQILGSQFWAVGIEVTGGNVTLAGDVEDIKARATAAFTESLKKGMENKMDKQSSDEM